MEKNSRISIGNFDLLKGVGIILVMLTHTFAHLDMEQSFGLFLLKRFVDATKAGLMPMFFMISGFGFKERTPRKMLKKTISDLLIPYLWVMIGYAVIYPIMYYQPAFGGWIEPTMMRSAQYVVAFLLGIAPIGTRVFGFETAWCAAAWYLLALFVALNILNLIVKQKRTTIQIVYVLLCVIVAGIMFHFGFVFFCIPQGLMAIGYCYTGYILKKYHLFERVRSSVWTYIFCVPVFLLEIKWGFYDLSQGMFKNIIGDYIAAGLSGALFMCLGVYFENCEWTFLEWLKRIGMYSYWVFAIHAVEMEALPWWYWQRPLAKHQWTALVLELIIKTCIMFIGCFALKKISKYNYRRRIMRIKN